MCCLLLDKIAACFCISTGPPFLWCVENKYNLYVDIALIYYFSQALGQWFQKHYPYNYNHNFSIFLYSVSSLSSALRIVSFRFHKEERGEGTCPSHTTTKWVGYNLKRGSVCHSVFPFYVHYSTLTATALVINILSPVTQWDTNWNSRSESCDVQMEWVMCGDEWLNCWPS